MTRITFIIQRQHVMIRHLMRDGISRQDAEQAIKRWHLGFDANSEVDKICFKLFEATQNKIQGK